MAADTASFALELIDRVSAPARAISKQLDAVNKRFKAFEKDTASSGLRGTLSNINGGLFSMAKTATYALGAAGVAVGAFVVKSVVHMGMFAEASRMAFGSLLGDGAAGNAVFAETLALAKDLGLNVEETTHAMQKMLAMQISSTDAKRYIALTADLKSVGVTAENVQRIMLDISHVKGTGILNMRELRTFAMAGVSTELMMEEVAKGIQQKKGGKLMTVPQVYEAMHKRQITSDIALPAFERAVMRKTHESTAGEAGRKFAGNTLTGLTGQLQNAPAQLFLKISEAATESIQHLKPLVQSIMDAIDKVDVSQTARFVGNVLDMMTSLVPLGLEFANGFGEGLSAISDVIGGGKVAESSLQSARDLGRSLAEAFATALTVLKKIMDAFVWLNEHRWAAWSLVGLYTALNIFSQMGNIAKGIELAMVAAKGLGALLGMGGGAGGAAAAVAKAVAPAGLAGAEQLGLNLAGTAGATQLGLFGGAEAAGATTAAGAAGGGMLAGAAAWGGTAVGAASVGALALAALPGLMIGGAGLYFREEIAKGMLGMMGPRADEAAGRGLGADLAQPTANLTGFETKLGSKPNNVTVGNINLQIDGTGKDGTAIGKEAAEAAGAHIQQTWQSYAFESGG